jgi:outer membrane protein assembly factor BamB
VWALPDGVFKTQGKFVSDIYADDFGVYAASTDTKLYCLDRVTGKIKWQYFAGVALKQAPVVTAVNVYQFVPGQGIVAIDKTNYSSIDRTARWAARDAVQVLSEDAADVYLRRRDNRLMAVDKVTGEVRYVSKSGSYSVFATNTSDAMIYAAKPSGEVVQIKPVNAAGEVGRVVMDPRAQPVASAR